MKRLIQGGERQRHFIIVALLILAALNFIAGDEFHGYVFVASVWLMLHLEALIDIAKELRKINAAVKRGDL